MRRRREREILEEEEAVERIMFCFCVSCFFSPALLYFYTVSVFPHFLCVKK